MEEFFSFSGLSGAVDVLKIVDGDTIIISLPIDLKITEITDNCQMHKCGNYKLYVRLLGINTPEKNEIGYTEAKERLTQLITSCQSVKAFVKFHKYDKYGRILGEIYDPTDLTISFNKILLKEGLAKEYRDQP